MHKRFLGLFLATSVLPLFARAQPAAWLTRADRARLHRADSVTMLHAVSKLPTDVRAAAALDLN